MCDAELADSFHSDTEYRRRTHQIYYTTLAEEEAVAKFVRSAKV